jgi:hypothetical protein
MFLKPPKNISNPAAFIKIAGVPYAGAGENVLDHKLLLVFGN